MDRFLYIVHCRVQNGEPLMVMRILEVTVYSGATTIFLFLLFTQRNKQI